MGAHARLFGLAAAVVICGNLTASAQWRGVVTKGVPLTSAGTPNLVAPAPRLTDGKTPDLSGVWDAEKINAKVVLLNGKKMFAGSSHAASP